MEKELEPAVQAVTWKNDQCLLLDQTRLPKEEVYFRFESYGGVVKAIQDLAVRGAPAIGVAGAYAVVLAVREASTLPQESHRAAFFDKACEEIAAARPTAVNLRWAVLRMRERLGRACALTAQDTETALIEARAIHDEDIGFNRKMAQYGYELLPPNGGILTYCNTGDLATGGIGTAFGVLHEGFRRGKVNRVYACETRPVLQGARLTAWELGRNSIPFTLICDNMAATVMRQGKVSSVIVGADRIAANGDVANKIGTYGVAVIAQHHGIPFYVAAPSSTFDLSLKTGQEIPIEERGSEEVLSALGSNRSGEPIPVFNPAFDVTPHELIAAIICEKGIIERPDTDRVKNRLT